MRYIYLNPIKTTADKARAKKLPVLKKNDLSKLIKDRTETKVISPASAKRGIERRAAQHAEMFKELGTALKGKKSIVADMLKLSQEKLHATPRHKLFGTDGEVLLLNAESMLVDAFVMKRLREDRAQAAKALDDIVRVLKKKPVEIPPKGLVRLNKLIDVRKLDARQINVRIQEIARHWLEIINNTINADADLTSFGAETGEGNRADRGSTSPCGNPQNPKGLITLYRWPLKQHITSIKNQSRRGTCSAFGTISSVESAISVKYGSKVNLSEQDLYKKQRLDWTPSLTGEYNEDGYSPILSMLFQMVGSYVFPFERDWEYNPSRSRTPNGDGPWTMSCVGYNGLACSDTNHQAEKHTYRILTTEVHEIVHEVCEHVESIPIIGIIGGWFCDIVAEVIETVEETEVVIYETNVNGTSRYKVTGWIPIWDPIWDNDITAAKAMLASCVPMIFCFNVPDSFDDGAHTGPNGRGYIVYDANEKRPPDSGGHCVAMVGHIDNEDIPASWGLQPGAGGGYFILKNSWGHCWADRGFAYAPYDWVNKWGQAMVAITNVERI